MWPALAVVASLISVCLVFKNRRLRLAFEAEKQRLITEHHRQTASRDSQDEQSRLQAAALFSSMIEGVLVLDERDRVTLANPALKEIFSIQDDPRGKTLLEVIRHHDMLKLLERIRKEKEVRAFEIELTSTPWRSLEINAVWMVGAQGQIHGTLFVFHDLTQSRELERNRRDFVANVSHELRTPLSLIKGYVETLIDGAKDNPEVAEKFLKTIEKHADRLTFLIDDLLTISRLESGQIQLDCRPVNLALFIKERFQDFEARSSARQIKLLSQVSDGLTVNADPERLEQVFSNLLDNAIKYGRPGGNVEVTARTLAGTGVEIQVRDDGPGIPPDALSRVFERFYRVDKARSREQGGTGLGLSIVKHIVQSHGGEVRAESEYGRGATFIVTLPG